MNFSLIDEFVVETELSREELVAALRSKIYPRLSFREAQRESLAELAGRTSGCPYESPSGARARGKVTQDGFSVTHERFLNAAIRGRLESTSAGTTMEIMMTPHPMYLLFLAGVFLVVSLVIGLIVLGTLDRPEFWLVLVAAPALIAGACFAFRTIVRREMARQRTELEDWLQLATEPAFRRSSL